MMVLISTQVEMFLFSCRCSCNLKKFQRGMKFQHGLNFNSSTCNGLLRRFCFELFLEFFSMCIVNHKTAGGVCIPLDGHIPLRGHILTTSKD